uniref:C2H2-type domain-containing protein n=1 Tax=Salarias fasciatus TaxID=181472 RepID=A0A672F8V1_SALFA
LEADLVVKLESEDKPDENAAPLETDEFATEEDEAQLWMSGLCRDGGGPSVSYGGPPFPQIPAVFASQGGLLLDGAGSRVYSGVKSQSVLMSAARAKRRALTFACRRSQPEEGHGALSEVNCSGPSPIPQQNLHRDAASHPSHPDDQDPMAPVPTGHLYGRSGFGLVRRMRTPWRPGLGEKRFGCSFCDKTFMRFSQLKEHLRSHTGEKPYSCAQCGRSFTKQCNLIRHAVVHSGEKPYQCAMCGKCFTQRSSLKSHQKSSSSELFGVACVCIIQFYDLQRAVVCDVNG